MINKPQKPEPGQWIVIKDGYSKKLIRWTQDKPVPAWWEVWPADKSEEQKRLLR